MQPPVPQSEKDHSNRKLDHLSMAALSQTSTQLKDNRFYYEPLMSSHPKDLRKTTSFGAWDFDLPLWISSMTGGADHASTINSRLASACEEFKLGMGLGSLRPLLDNRQMKADFDVKHLMPSRPLFGNLGIAQLAELLKSNQSAKIYDLIEELKLDGFIIHVNPLQEWFQPQGDRFTEAPLEVIEKFLDNFKKPLIVKEVGHGMGPSSLRALIKLNLFAIEFAAFGGTNFSLLESKRGSAENDFIYVGHSALEMISFVKDIQKTNNNLRTQNFIISGGVKDALTAYHYTQLLPHSLAGVANSVLAPARIGEIELREYLNNFKNQFALAQAFLKVRGE